MPVTHLFTFLCFFFFNDTATTEIYTLSLHDALPIWARTTPWRCSSWTSMSWPPGSTTEMEIPRSEEHTSELQSHSDLVCRLLLEKKNKRQSDLDVANPHDRNGSANTQNELCAAT